jgi:hypothetical protein
MKKAFLLTTAAAALFSSQVMAQGGPRGPRGQAGNGQCPRMSQNCPRRANCPNPNCPNPNCPRGGQKGSQSQAPATPPAK